MYGNAVKSYCRDEELDKLEARRPLYSTRGYACCKRDESSAALQCNDKTIGSTQLERKPTKGKNGIDDNNDTDCHGNNISNRRTRSSSLLGARLTKLMSSFRVPEQRGSRRGKKICSYPTAAPATMCP